MTTILLEDEWIKTAQLFGDVKSIIKEALRAYSIGQCQQRIHKATVKDTLYSRKYHCDYPTFKQAIQTDEGFLTRIEKDHPLWEEDAMEWEYWLEELQTWRNQLAAILQR